MCVSLGSLQDVLSKASAIATVPPKGLRAKRHLARGSPPWNLNGRPGFGATC